MSTSWRAPRPGRDPGRGVVRVDVAHDALLVARERRHDRHLARDEEAVEEVAADPGDGRHEADVREPLADEQPAVHPREPHGVAADVPERGDELAVDDAAEHRGRDLERRGIGDPEAALEAGGHAEALEPLGHPLAAAVHEHDRPLACDRGHLGQDLALLGERRAAELDDDDLAHDVYSAFSLT